MTEYSRYGHSDIPWHRRRRSIYAVLLAIAIVFIGIGIGLAFGPIIPAHPVTPGTQVSPPATTTSPTPSTTSTSQDEPTYSIAINHIRNVRFPMLDRF